MPQSFSLSLSCTACLINFPCSQFLVEAYSRSGIRSARLSRKQLISRLDDVQKRLIVKSTEKSFEPLTLKDIEEALDMAGGCLIGMDREPQPQQSATFLDHFKRALSAGAGPLYQSLWAFMKTSPTNSTAEERIAHRYIAALQPSSELLDLWEKFSDEGNTHQLGIYHDSYNVALQRLGKLEFRAEKLKAYLTQDKPNEFEFEERAFSLLGLKCFPWEFMGLMNKVYSPAEAAALLARFSKIPFPNLTCNFS